MTPQSQPRRRSNSSRVNLLISLAFHTTIVVALTYFAAREGLLGQELKKIAVQMVKEKPPEPAKPKDPEEPRDEAPKPEKTVEPAPPPKPAASPPPAASSAATAPPPGAFATPPSVAPPATAMPAFVFGGGRAVQSSTDPVQVYRSLVEFALRSKWDRPTDLADNLFVAEAEVAVDRTGRVSDPVWKKGSGNDRWDAAVKRVLASPTTLTRPPPTNFPPRVLVRFDVQEIVDASSDELTLSSPR